MEATREALCLEVKKARWPCTVLMYFFPNLEPVYCSMSSSNCCFLSCIQIFRRQLRWSGIPITWRIFQFVAIHTVKDFSVVNKAVVFLEFPCFLYDPVGIGSSVCGSSAFSKSSLNIWKFLFHILLKPGLENSKHYFAGMWDECNCAIIWTFFCNAFLWYWNENWPFPVLWSLLSFPNPPAYECTTLTLSSFSIWNSSAGIPSFPLTFFIVMLCKAHLPSYSRISDSRWVITPSWLSGSLRHFLYSSSVYSHHLFLISSVSVRFCTTL